MRAAFLVPFCTVFAVATANAENLVFMLDNQSSTDLYEFYASPTDVDSWEDDILGSDILPAGEALRVTIADGRENCEYDVRMIFADGDVLDDVENLCETGSYTITD